MKIELRKALLGNDHFNKDTSKGVSVAILIGGVLKPISMSQTDGVGAIATPVREPSTVEYNSALSKVHTPRKTAVQVKNSLVDPDMVNRFEYLGHIESQLFGTVDVAWYDAKYKDIIIIPDLSTIPIHSTTTLDGQYLEYSVRGYAFRSNIENNNSDMGTEPTKAIGNSPHSNFPSPLVTSGITSHLFPLSNIFGDSAVKNSGYVIGERYFEGQQTKLVEMYSLGGTDTLFGGGVRHDSYTLHRTSKKHHELMYIGDQILDDILLVRV